MKVKNFFKEKYLNYQVTIYEQDLSCETKYFYINFTMDKRDKVSYYGLFTKQDRESINYFIKNYKDRQIDDRDIDRDNKIIYLYLI